MIELYFLLSIFAFADQSSPHAPLERDINSPSQIRRSIDTRGNSRTQNYKPSDFPVPCGTPFPEVRGKPHLLQVMVEKVNNVYKPAKQISAISECAVLKIDIDGSVSQLLLAGINKNSGKLLTRIPGSVLGNSYDPNQFFTMLPKEDPSRPANWVVVPCGGQKDELTIMDGEDLNGTSNLEKPHSQVTDLTHGKGQLETLSGELEKMNGKGDPDGP